jgi:hypothetical protein
MQVGRCKEHDHLIEKLDCKEPHVIHDTSVLRQMGWFCECDQSCTTCGLATMDGDFPLCEHCEQCAECGHLDDCASRKTA